VQGLIEQAGHRVIDISGTSAAGSTEAARSAVAAGAQRLITVGGDGTLHLAVQAVAGTKTTLGVIPAGTGNDFARAFGLNSLSIEDATWRALSPAAPVDAIRSSNGRWVAFNVTGGFTVDVNDRAAALRFPKGPSRYTVATLLTLGRLRHRQVAITIDGERYERSSALFAVANTATFGGGMAICPDADPRDGVLDIALLGPASRITMLNLLTKVFRGAHTGHSLVEMLQGRCVTVDGEQMELVGDGEAIGTSPMTLEVVPGALQVAGVAHAQNA